MAKKLCYAKPTRSSWPLKQGRMGDLSQLKEDLEQKITTWQREVDLKLMKSVWGAHVRTPEEDDLSEECVFLRHGGLPPKKHKTLPPCEVHRRTAAYVQKEV